MMNLEQMIALLTRASALPHATTADVFMTAGMMAEAVEAVAPTNGKKTEDKSKTPVLTVKRLRDLGLEYDTVADCAHDLVKIQGMTESKAAARMGATPRQVRMSLRNWEMRNRPATAAKKESAK